MSGIICQCGRTVSDILFIFQCGIKDKLLTCGCTAGIWHDLQKIINFCLYFAIFFFFFFGVDYLQSIKNFFLNFYKMIGPAEKKLTIIT